MNRNARDRTQRGREESDLIDRLVGINRVAKVVKGGRRFGFTALVIVGDGRGRVGYGSGKAREVPEAIRKATERAKRRMIRVPLREGRTLHHDIEGRKGAGKVVLRAAPPGTGIIAGGPMRAVFECLGVQGRGDQVAGQCKRQRHGARDVRRSGTSRRPARHRGQARQEGQRDFRPPGRRGGGLERWRTQAASSCV